MEYNHLLGAILAFLSALFWATNDIFNKLTLRKGYDENFVLWIRFPLGVIFLLPLGLHYWELNEKVLLTTLFWLPTEIVASVLFIKAIKFSPLSVAMPFFAFMPLFSALSGWLFLGESLDLRGFLGLLLIVYGSILLSGGNLQSFFEVNRGALYALISAALFGFNVVIGKIAVVSSNQFFFAWYYCLVMSLGLLPFVKIFPPPQVIIKEKTFLAIGVLFSLGMLFYTWAYIYTYASYVAALERLAILLDIIYGKIFFKEKVKYALRASIFMVLGAILLSL